MPKTFTDAEVFGTQSKTYTDEEVFGSQPPTSAGEAAGRGFFNTATFNFYDELKGLARAGGFDPNDPQTDNEIKALFKGAYRYFTGDKEAEKLYEQEKKRVEEETKRLEEAHPYASFGGSLGGAVALPIAAAAKGATIGARALAAGKTGAVTGGLSGAGAGEGTGGRVLGAAVGAPVGGVVGAAAPYVVEPVVRGAAAIASPVTSRIRGALYPEAEATRQIGVAAVADAAAPAAGRAGLTAAEFADELAAGTPVAVIDRLGQEGLSAARRATNLSPTALGTLGDLAQERYRSTGARLSDWMRGAFHYPDADAQRIAIAEAARNANAPAYRRAMQEAAQLHPGGLWDEGFEQISQAPIVQDAIRKASVTGANRAAREGFTPVGNPFRFDRETGRMTLREGGPRPTLQFWDQVKQNLDKVNTRESADWSRVLRERIDELVPSYGEARAGAAHFFGARDMLNAGEQFVGAAQKYGIPEARRALAAASPQERQLFHDGYASRLIQALDAKGGAARTNMLNNIRNSRAAREELELGLGGRDRAEAFQARMRVESVMDRLRTNLGNSTTVRQAIDTGLLGIGGGAAIYDPSTFAGPAGLALALRGGNRFINQRVAARVAELLASNDQAVVERGINMVTRNPKLMAMLEGADNWMARIAGTNAPELSSPLKITVGGTPQGE
jgi:hypothetical protein